MAEYIDREAMAKFISQVRMRLPHESKDFFTRDEMLLNFEQYIRITPPADVAPVKHGKWIWNPDGMDWGLGAWECSECACRNNNLGMNSKMNPLMFSGSKYCPNCGAKMDGE